MAANGFKFRMRGFLAATALSVVAIVPVACTSGTGLDLATNETLVQGYVFDDQTLALVPEGSSRDQVLLALGTPTTTATFEGDEVFYYISQTRKRSAQFLKPRLVDQRVLSVYFEGEDQVVSRIANYGVQDGRVFDFISRTTPTATKDETFLSQLLSGTFGRAAPNLGQ